MTPFQPIPVVTLIQSILDKTLKNGKPVVRLEEQRHILEQLRDFNPEASWMESKDYTKLLKILASQLSDYTKDPESGDTMICLYENIIYFTGHHLDHGRRFTKSPEAFERMAARLVELGPLFDMLAVVGKRLTKNGKFPKEVEERIKQEAIKGAMHPILRTELERITESFRVKIENYFKQKYRDDRTKATEWFLENTELFLRVQANKNIYKKTTLQIDEHNLVARALKSFNKVVIDGTKGLFKTDEEIDQMAQEVATFESQSFFFKMSDKLGGLISPALERVKEGMVKDGNPWVSFLHFWFKDGSKFSVQNNVVLNWSPLGTPFYQFPTTFFEAYRADGTKIKNVDEASIKQYFKDGK